MLEILLFFLPSWINVFIRRTLGQNIGKGTRIRFGTYLNSSEVSIGKNCKLGPFVFIKTKSFSLGDHVSLKSLSLIYTHKFKAYNYVHIAPLVIIKGNLLKKSSLIVGEHSRIFPFCWIEPGEGVNIGKHVGVGGHSLIFTHGAWSDYIDGGPVSYGSVNIEDYVWLPWRVFILPNSTIGKGAIIGASSLVNKNIPEGVLAAGIPARVVKEGVIESLSIEKRQERLEEVLKSFAEYALEVYGLEMNYIKGGAYSENFCVSYVIESDLQSGDLFIDLEGEVIDSAVDSFRERQINWICHKDKSIYIVKPSEYLTSFLAFIRRYGIRLTVL